MNSGLTISDAEKILDEVVTFPDINASFQRLRAITNFRKDDSEARILYLCRRLRDDDRDVGDIEDKEDLYVLKCKVQAPSVLAGGLTTPIEGPHEHTLDEIKALRIFADVKPASLPRLVSWKKTTQDSTGLMPGGYISYVAMTLMPGKDLLDAKFWSMSEEQQEEIRAAFVVAIKEIWRLGFNPYDCALRNILWEEDTHTLSIVDFEHWQPATKDPINMNEREEMQRWGIVKRPLPQYHWQVWREAATLSGHEQTWY